MHNIKPNTTYKIITLQLAVPATMNPSEVADGISEMMTHSMSSHDAVYDDWAYTEVVPLEGSLPGREIVSDEAPQEGEIFLK